MKRPPRFVVSSSAIEAGSIRIEGAELHHLRDVMRAKPGLLVTVVTGDGIEYAGRLIDVAATHATVQCIVRTPRNLSMPLILAAAIIKGPRMDFLVEKAAELGATELWPITSARTQAHAPGEQRLARWRRLATAAAKQSLSAAPMAVHPARDFARMLADAPPGQLRVMARIGAPPLAQAVRHATRDGIFIACGPEGDFDDAEVGAAARAGFVFVGLGTTRLRSETAALAALALAVATLDELKQGA